MPPRRRRFFLFEMVGQSGDRFTLLDTEPNISQIGGHPPQTWYWYLGFNETPWHPQYGIGSSGELTEANYRHLRFVEPQQLGTLRTGRELKPDLWKWLLSQLQSVGATQEEITEVFTGVKSP